MGKPVLDITNTRFGRLVARYRDGSVGGVAIWVCDCDCGEKCRVRSKHLRNGRQKSCGCLRRERSAETGRAQAGKKTSNLTQKDYARRYRETHPEKVKETSRRVAADWKQRNPERARRGVQESKRKRRAHHNALNAERNYKKRQAMPPWADRDQIAAIYERARAMTVATGEPYQVDHIVPIQGKNVCGLHVDWNLQVLPAAENTAKHNHLIEAQAIRLPDSELQRKTS